MGLATTKKPTKTNINRLNTGSYELSNLWAFESFDTRFNLVYYVIPDILILTKWEHGYSLNSFIKIVVSLIIL